MKHNQEAIELENTIRSADTALSTVMMSVQVSFSDELLLQVLRAE
jgi:hypothetical protein